MIPRISRLSVLILLCTTSTPTGDLHASPPPWDGVRFRGPELGPHRLPHSDPAAKRAAGLNVGEPRTVRLIYFRSKDRPFRQELVDAMKAVIDSAQTFYAEHMERHGYGYRTFRVETDATGEAVVHNVVSKHHDISYASNSHLQNDARQNEIEGVFDSYRNILFVAADVSNWRAGGAARGKNGGIADCGASTVLEAKRAWYPGNHPFYSILHELGHAFGLEHDWRDGAYIMSYGPPGWDRLSACAAEFLSAHPYFNHDVPIEDTPAPAVELISSRGYPTGSTSVSLRLNVTDSDGLHQVILLAHGGLKACQGMNGERSAVVEFDYDGVVPTGPSQSKGLSNPPVHPIIVKAVDNNGNIGQTSFALFDVSTMRDLAVTLEVGGNVNSMAFSPDGTTLASGGAELKLWDVSNWSEIATFWEFWILSMAFSPNGRTLALGGSALALWDVAEQTRIATLEDAGWFHSVAFSPDGTTLASGGEDTMVRLWDVAKRTQIATLEGHTSKIDALAFSPDGKTLASGGSELKLWDVAKQTGVATIRDVGWIDAVAFSPDGTTLASGGSALTLWDVATRTKVATLGNEGWFISVAFSPDGKTLASGGLDGAAKLWNVATRRRIATFSAGDRGEVIAVAFSPDGAMLASGYYHGPIQLWDLSKYLPHSLEIVSGDGQQGAPGESLGQPLVVEIRDPRGDPLPGARVTFTVTAGAGRLSGRFKVQHTTTDANGRAELNLTLGPDPGPNTVVVSLDERDMATFQAQAVGDAVAELDGDYRTWHLPTAATARLGKGAMGESDRAVALSADGRFLAVASSIGVWLYEAATSRALALLPTGSGVHSVAFSLNGTLASGLDNGIVELWDVETGTSLGTLRQANRGRVTAVAFSPDGTRLASGSWDQVIKLWDIEARREVGAWEVPREGTLLFPLSVAFSPDGSKLASGFQDGTVRLWDVATRTEVASLEGHTDRVASVSFSPDRLLLASAGARRDPTVRLWNTETRTEVARLTGHTGGVRSVVFSPTHGDTLASGSEDGTVRLWNLAGYEEVATLEEQSEGFVTVTFSPDGATLVSSALDGSVLLRDVETGNAAGLSGHASLSSMALSGDGVNLALGYQDGTVRLWDAATVSRIAALQGHSSVVLSVSFSSDGATLASGSWDRTVTLWDVRTRESLGTLAEHRGGVRSVAFSPDDVTLASGSLDRTVRLWDARTREQIGIFEGHNGDVRSVAFSSDGALLASGGGNDDKTVRLWNVATRELIGTLEGHTRAVTAVAVSPDNSLLASGSWDRTIRLWDVKTREQTATLDERSQVYSLAFSADGATLVSGSSGRTDLWNVKTREQIATLEGHTRSVHSVSFSDDGNLLATGSSDGTTLLWDLAKYLSPRIPDPDFDGDGTVGFTDFLQFAAQFGLGQGDTGYDARFDLDGNGAIGFSDFLVFASNFGRGV